MRSITGNDHEGLLFLLLPDHRLDPGWRKDLFAALAFAAVGLTATAIALIAGLAVG
jgi:hypothetical protein